LFSNIQACVNATRSVHHSPSVFTAPSQGCSYSIPAPGPSSFPAPPPLVRAPVQLSMPFMYAPMYLPCPAQQTQEPGHEEERCIHSLPFLLVFVKGNISRCAGCGKKNLRDVNGKCTLPLTIYASCTRNSLHLRIPTLDYVKHPKREGMFTTTPARHVCYRSVIIPR
jgi:hypothetical protein